MSIEKDWRERLKEGCDFDGEFVVGCYECGRQINEDSLKQFIQSILDKREEEVRKEERQFILNVLDGVDIADQQMGNVGGGTKAIRFALQSRTISLIKEE